MKVLVTGHKGFIGQNLVNYIKKNTDLEVDGWEWGDSAFPTVQGYDWVIHLGAITSTTERDAAKVLQQNTEFSKALFKACQVNFVKFQYASSAGVYGLESDFKETSPCTPVTPYAWSKRLFEVWEDMQPLSFGCASQGFRYFNVYGNYEDHKGDQASPITKFSKQNPIQLFRGSDEYFRDFVAVEDICRIHVEFMQNGPVRGVWNIGTGTARSFQDVANVISRRNNTPIEYIDMPEVLREGYQRFTRADLTKLEDTIGTQRWISIEEWLDKYKI